MSDNNLSVNKTNLTLRHDIQFLRGIAVISVVFYHGGIDLLSNGYLGVDVFFVISGFLITRIILRSLAENSFSFGVFYLRRAKRLLPALYCTLIFTTLLAYGFLSPQQWKDYFEQLIGAITFTSNLILPLQSGYFEGSAEGKPLLHIWSLSLEEQYYFLLPLCLYFTPRNLRGWILVFGVVFSFSLCFYAVTWPFEYWRFPNLDTDGWAFYLLPTRAWELLAGSLCAWYMLKNPTTEIPKVIKFISLIGLALIICFSVDTTHPRGNSAISVVLTCLMILGRDDWLPKHLSIRCIEKVGDWSYSLYLVHWPLLAFANLAYLGDIPTTINLTIVCFSIFVAYMQYQYVEQRFRKLFQRSTKFGYKFFAYSTLIVILLPIPMAYSIHSINSPDESEKTDFRRANLGLSDKCTNFADGIHWPSECMTKAEPKIAIWGDSFAMHLVAGINANLWSNNSVLQITKSSCGPILDIGRIADSYNRQVAAKCINHNKVALQKIISYDSIKYVVLGSAFRHYFQDSGQSFLFNNSTLPFDKSIAISQLTETIKIIQAAGKIPIIVSSPPRTGFNIGDCIERLGYNLPVFGREDCNIPIQKHREFERETSSALKEIQLATDVRILWLDLLMCNEVTCQTETDNVPLYVDHAHLTHEGSKLVLANIDLLEASN